MTGARQRHPPAALAGEWAAEVDEHGQIAYVNRMTGARQRHPPDVLAGQSDPPVAGGPAAPQGGASPARARLEPRFEAGVRPAPPRRFFQLADALKAREYRPLWQQLLAQAKEEIASETRKPKPLRWLLRLVRTIFADKMYADAVCLRQHCMVSPLPEFLLEWASSKFGLKTIAKQTALDLYVTATKWSKSSMEAETVLHFLDESMSPQELWFYVFCRTLVGSSSAKEQVGSAHIAVVVEIAMQHQPARQRLEVLEQVEGLADEEGRVDQEVFLRLLMSAYMSWQDESALQLENVFRTMDAANAGCILVSQLPELMSCVLDTIPEDKMQALFQKLSSTLQQPLMVINLENALKFMQRIEFMAMLSTVFNVSHTDTKMFVSDLRVLFSIATSNWANLDAHFLKSILFKLEKSYRNARAHGD
jgi:Ca2+-binding EF-hand superfamily protein